ncbi:MAG: HypC/HybG/HupF family hydrogenase formation chaperone [Acidobacteriia bacterium]|nr:HypC/HybG/HupF family hydrogenase formation chaperone [Terriglobia bacterium]
MCLAVPGQLKSIDNNAPLIRTGRVSFGGIIKQVNLACVPEAKVGDFLLVHVGFAIGIIDEQAANQIFEYLAEMDELKELQET